MNIMNRSVKTGAVFILGLSAQNFSAQIGNDSMHFILLLNAGYKEKND